MKDKLTIEMLQQEARNFAQIESQHDEPTLFGVTDGKAIGTYFEQKFQMYLSEKYQFIDGSTARGIDFPGLKVDMKVTSFKQPQSSCPFKSARQKIYGLGYHLLVFVYEKTDNPENSTGRLNIQHAIFVTKRRTADFQTTMGIQQILNNEGNEDDLIAFMQDRYLPVDDIEAKNIAEEVLDTAPEIGYLTISNALQWRLQYKRVITEADQVDGITRIR